MNKFDRYNVPEPEKPIVQTETLCRDDFIEWVLKSTNEDTEFRLHITKSYINVGIDRFPY